MGGGYVVMELRFNCSSVMGSVGRHDALPSTLGDMSPIYIARPMDRSQGVSGVYIVHAYRLRCITASHNECHARLLRRETLKLGKADGATWGGNVGPLRVSVATSLPRSFLRSCLRVSVSRKLQLHHENYHDVTAGSAYGAGEYTESSGAANGG